MSSFKGTTILAVRKDGKVAIAGDGQVTFGDTILKGNAHTENGGMIVEYKLPKN